MRKMNSTLRGRANTDRLLRLSEVLDIVPVSRTTWYDGMKIGLYPNAISLGGRRVAWWEHDVLSCIEALNAGTTKANAKKQAKEGK